MSFDKKNAVIFLSDFLVNLRNCQNPELDNPCFLTLQISVAVFPSEFPTSMA